jgi:hypothetical protein
MRSFMSKCLYLIGSLRNERIPVLANKIRKDNPDFEVFDDWYSAGPEADDYWKAHQRSKGLSYREALQGFAAKNVYNFDKRHLDRSSHALLVLPAGRSGHMEIMYAAYGVGASAAILLDEKDDRWDVMYQFIPNILHSDKEINKWLTSMQPSQNAEKDTGLLKNTPVFLRDWSGPCLPPRTGRN